MKTLLPYVPSTKHNLENFKWRMKYYADHVAGNILGNVGSLGTPHAQSVGKGRQHPESTQSSPSTSLITPSLQSVGYSNASINTRLDVVEEGLDQPNYYVSQ